jgi:hypothetical protein
MKIKYSSYKVTSSPTIVDQLKESGVRCINREGGQPLVLFINPEFLQTVLVMAQSYRYDLLIFVISCSVCREIQFKN